MPDLDPTALGAVIGAFVLAIIGMLLALRLRHPTHRELRSMEDRLTGMLRRIDEKVSRLAQTREDADGDDVG
jgi:hypothetical protein